MVMEVFVEVCFCPQVKVALDMDGVWDPEFGDKMQIANVCDSLWHWYGQFGSSWCLMGRWSEFRYAVWCTLLAEKLLALGQEIMPFGSA